MAISFCDPGSITASQRESGTVLSPKFDAQGLVTAVVVDAASSEVLMVAHMNAEALSLSLETGYAHYFSRSRQRIWKKGETSGEVQKIVEIRTDCDQDAFVLAVEQLGHGAACHTGRRSCFYRRIETSEKSPRLSAPDVPRLFDPAEVY